MQRRTGAAPGRAAGPSSPRNCTVLASWGIDVCICGCAAAMVGLKAQRRGGIGVLYGHCVHRCEPAAYDRWDGLGLRGVAAIPPGLVGAEKS